MAVSSFGEISPIWQFLKVFGNFWGLYLKHLAKYFTKFMQWENSFIVNGQSGHTDSVHFLVILSMWPERYAIFLIWPFTRIKMYLKAQRFGQCEMKIILPNTK